jgi:N utilization substance protein A
MKGSRVQSIIKELRGEKIDIIEWSDEPSVFAANALSPAKVSQVRITDIDKRKMHVIVGEDQLSLAIGKKGQNVRLATRLVGWDIDIVSEEVLKKEIAQQMGKMMASGEAVPLTALEGVTSNQAEILAGKGVDDVEKLAAMSIDDLVEALDVTFDDADRIISAAREVVAAKEGSDDPVEGGESEGTEEAVESESVETAEETAEDVVETEEVAEAEVTADPADVEAASEASEEPVETAEVTDAAEEVLEASEGTEAEVEADEAGKAEEAQS